MKRIQVYIYLLALFFIVTPALHAQTIGGSNVSGSNSSTASNPSMTSTQFDMTGFPQWTRDLRRGEIVAFGSFPFAYFFTSFSYDLFRFASNGGNMLYAPWPLKPAGAIEPSQGQKLSVIGIAAGGAVVIALVDYVIVRYKRHRQEAEIQKLSPGTPIIIRKPLYDDGSSESGSGTATEGSGPAANTQDSPKTGNP